MQLLALKSCGLIGSKAFLTPGLGHQKPKAFSISGFAACCVTGSSGLRSVMLHSEPWAWAAAELL